VCSSDLTDLSGIPSNMLYSEMKQLIYAKLELFIKFLNSKGFSSLEEVSGFLFDDCINLSEPLRDDIKVALHQREEFNLKMEEFKAKELEESKKSQVIAELFGKDIKTEFYPPKMSENNHR